MPAHEPGRKPIGAGPAAVPAGRGRAAGGSSWRILPPGMTSASTARSVAAPHRHRLGPICAAQPGAPVSPHASTLTCGTLTAPLTAPLTGACAGGGSPSRRPPRHPDHENLAPKVSARPPLADGDDRSYSNHRVERGKGRMKPLPHGPAMPLCSWSRTSRYETVPIPAAQSGVRKRN